MRRTVLGSLFTFLVAIATAAPAQVLTTLYTFCSLQNCTDGSLPHAGLIESTDGDLYGTTEYGWPNGDGTIFKITAGGTLTTMHNFDGADGFNILSGVVQGIDGNFYGTAWFGGANDDPSCDIGTFVGCGTVYKISPGGTFTTLYSFCAEQDCFDGSNPSRNLVQGKDGNLYGTTGGQLGGTIFRITPDGTLTTLYNFCSLRNCADGKWANSLVQGSDGNFYGTTYLGGTSNNCDDYWNNLFGCGTVFKVTPGGVLTTLHSFDNSDGCYPEVGLVQGSDGDFYGSTSAGGLRGCNNIGTASGTIFKITPTGTLTKLYSFCSLNNCADGRLPYGELVQGSDGNFYGTTNGGGTNNDSGTIFKITPSGGLTTLYSFCALQNCVDGILPYGALVQATDGKLYGTTYEGGAHGSGTVFQLDAGLFSVLSVAKTGSGTITSVDRHIYCGSACSSAYANGTAVTLSAIPTPGYTFTGWTGCDNMNGSYCSVTMTSAKNVTATFTTANITLTSLTFKPSYVKGGQLSAGTLTLSGPLLREA